ncbi:hypothetical protein ACFLTG_04005 [Chloroflexota bacterium]
MNDQLVFDNLIISWFLLSPLVAPSWTKGKTFEKTFPVSLLILGIRIATVPPNDNCIK